MMILKSKPFFMKKNIVLLAAAIFSIISLKAQQTHFGIKGGLNIASVEVKDGDDYNSKAGIHFGGLAHIHVSKHFAVQPELVFSMQGGKDGDFKLNLNYINLPVLAQYMANDGFRLQTGPQIGFNVGAESKLGNVEVDISDDINTIDLAWVFGASYLFPQGIGIDARYNLGLNNINETDTFVEKNRVFQVGLFYQFMHHNKRK
jgi:hypothetical protein